jgi:hypothetical protein
MSSPLPARGVPTQLCDDETLSFDDSVLPDSPILRSPSPATPPLIAELAYPWGTITVSYHEI